VTKQQRGFYQCVFLLLSQECARELGNVGRCRDRFSDPWKDRTHYLCFTHTPAFTISLVFFGRGNKAVEVLFHTLPTQCPSSKRILSLPSTAE